MQFMDVPMTSKTWLEVGLEGHKTWLLTLKLRWAAGSTPYACNSQTRCLHHKMRPHKML